MPTPPRGHWAKLAAGKKVKQTIFADAADPLLDRIEIHRSLANLPPTARDIIESARKEREARKPARRSQIAPVTFVPVKEPHPAVRATARQLRQSKPGSDGSVCALSEGHCGIATAPTQVERIIALLDALARALDTIPPYSDRIGHEGCARTG